MNRFLKSLSLIVVPIVFLFFFLVHPSNIVLADVLTYSGVLTDGSGTPLSGWNLNLSDGVNNAGGVTTAADGSFSMNIPGGTYNLSLSPGNNSDLVHLYNENWTANASVTVNSNTVQNIAIPFTTLTVIILDSNGDPVPGAAISLSNGNALPITIFPGTTAEVGSFSASSGSANASGVIQMKVIPNSSTTIHVFTPNNSLGSFTETVAFSDPNTTLTVTLPPVVTYGGILTDSSGNTLSGWDINLNNSINNAGGTTTAADGSFSLNIPAGTYGLSIGPGNNSSLVLLYNEHWTAGTTVTVNTNTVQNISIPLTTLTVIVLDADGNPVPGAVVSFDGANALPITIFPSTTADVGAFLASSGSADASGTIQMIVIPNSTANIHVFTPNNILGSLTKTVSFPDPNTTLIVTFAVPIVGVITAPSTPVQVNTSMTASASFMEGAFTAPHTATWDWGDGTISTGTVTESGNSGTVQNSHTYTATGVYPITLVVTDQYGDTGSSVFQYVAVYAPSPSSLFTGARIFTSPAGAFAQNTSLTGQVQFGVSVKYQNNLPTGKVNMDFKAANLDFKATSYQYLVVSGNKATLRGNGTINGSGNYNFLITGIAGGQNTQDLIRFQIKDSSNNVIYDTQPGGSDTDDPTTEVTGQIIVQ